MELQRKEKELEEYVLSLEKTGRYPSFVLDALQNYDHDEINLPLTLELVKYICRTMEPGAILIFLPG